MMHECGLISFSVKALSNVAILKVLKQCGCGFDIVSGGELHRALLAGADPQKIIFSGVGKSKAEMAAGIKSNILSFNVESESELMVLEEVAKELALVGIDIEIIDVQSLLPFDLNHDTVKSVAKTNRLLVIDEDVPGGASAYLLQEIIENHMECSFQMVFYLTTNLQEEELIL